MNMQILSSVSERKKLINAIYCEEVKMANIKSAKKRVLVAARNAERNKAIKSSIKTEIKKVYAAIDGGDKAACDVALNNAISAISKATSKGVFHKSTASRKISRLSLAVNKVK